MTLTEQQVRQMMPLAGSRLDAHLPYIPAALAEARIDTPRRLAAFMAQLAHESGEYRWMEELADGWAYEGRADLGNVQPGDGPRYKGHGPIQITGRANHRACGIALGIDCEAHPELLTTPEHGTRAACWFWNSRRLSLLADRNWFLGITKAINGGYNGLQDRLGYWNRNLNLLGLPLVDTSKEGDLVRAFQFSAGLLVDGVIGPRTLAALEAVARQAA